MEYKMELHIKKRISRKFSEKILKRKSLAQGMVIKSSPEIQSNSSYDQTDSLQQTVSNICIFILINVYLVWCLWLIIKESDVILDLRVFLRLKRFEPKVLILLVTVLFIGESMVKSVCVTKHTQFYQKNLVLRYY